MTERGAQRRKAAMDPGDYKGKNAAGKEKGLGESWRKDTFSVRGYLKSVRNRQNWRGGEGNCVLGVQWRNLG